MTRAMKYSYDRRAKLDPAAFGRETAKLVAKAAGKFAYKLLSDSLFKKEITHHEAVDERVLTSEVEKLAVPYFVEVYEALASEDIKVRRNGRADATDWDGEFKIRVLRPALAAAFKRGPKYGGFGPMSFFGKLRRIEHIPYHTAMQKQEKAFFAAHPELGSTRVRVRRKKKTLVKR